MKRLKGAVRVRKGFLKNLVALALTLVLTLGVVLILSAATKISPDAAAEYSRQVREGEAQVEEFSAPAHTHDQVSFLEAAGGFLLIIGVSAGAAVLLLRLMRKGWLTHTGQAYKPRNDMSYVVRRVL